MDISYRRKCLQNRAEALQRTPDSIVRALRERITVAHREHNSLSSIHKLPSELLANIFMLALKTRSGRFRDLHRFSSVSSTWNSVIRHTPALWATMTSVDSGALIKRALKLSQNAPLTILFDGVREGDYTLVASGYAPVAREVVIETDRLVSTDFRLGPVGPHTPEPRGASRR